MPPRRRGRPPAASSAASSSSQVASSGALDPRTDADELELEAEDESNLQVIFQDNDDDDVELKERRRQRELYYDRLRKMLDEFTPEQRDRHEMYRRSRFRLQRVKKVMMQTADIAAPNKTTLIFMAAIAKIFTGELVEIALDVQKERQDSGALLPCHIREALRRLRNQGKVPNTAYKKSIFKQI